MESLSGFLGPLLSDFLGIASIRFLGNRCYPGSWESLLSGILEAPGSRESLHPLSGNHCYPVLQSLLSDFLGIAAVS
jgi:hypothetical protein